MRLWGLALLWFQTKRFFFILMFRDERLTLNLRTKTKAIKCERKQIGFFRLGLPRKVSKEIASYGKFHPDDFSTF